GIIGLVIFILFSFVLLIKGEQIFHQTKDPVRRGIVMSALLCLIVIDAFLLINDLVETDKVGSFLFICAALLVNTDYYNRDQKERAAPLKSS
ncbi:MAG: O-antigen ligase family protein, partial [Bacteroidota bacterium]